MKDTKPGASLNVTVSTRPNALVGLLGIDQSVLLLLYIMVYLSYFSHSALEKNHLVTIASSLESNASIKQRPTV